MFGIEAEVRLSDLARRRKFARSRRDGCALSVGMAVPIECRGEDLLAPQVSGDAEDHQRVGRR
jgi:hypothetical protein